VKNLIKAIKINEDVEDDKMDVIKIISLRRLIDGGAAMFAQVKMNHHIVIVGPTHINPFVRNRLRVLVIS